MRLLARIPPDWNQAIIQGTIKVQHIEERLPIVFLVDTGCTETTLLQGDAIRLRIDWSNLPFKPEDVTTASGQVRPRLLSNVDIFLPIKEGFLNRNTSEIMKHYDQIDLMYFGEHNAQLQPPLRICTSYSILGMDILESFTKWIWKSDRLIMDGEYHGQSNS